MIQPCIATPTHATLPSGHAAQAYLIAALLTRLRGGDADAALALPAMDFRIAARIAVNRTVAGVHFPVDSACGAALGLALAEHVAACCLGTACAGWTFDAAAFLGDDPRAADFHEGTPTDMIKGGSLKRDAAAAGLRRAGEPILRLLWKEAAAELGPPAGGAAAEAPPA
jgi:hypothetical protein